MSSDDISLAAIRLGCLKLAALSRTESTTVAQLCAKADEYFAYVTRRGDPGAAKEQVPGSRKVRADRLKAGRPSDAKA